MKEMKGKDMKGNERKWKDMVGNEKPIDHIGIRVTNPVDRLQWYADKLGFVNEIMSYPPNDDPLKNGPPWITRTATVRGNSVAIVVLSTNYYRKHQDPTLCVY